MYFGASDGDSNGTRNELDYCGGDYGGGGIGSDHSSDCGAEISDFSGFD